MTGGWSCGQAKKRLRDEEQKELEGQDEEALMREDADRDRQRHMQFQLLAEDLLNLLKQLSVALADSQGSGTPAIHMYSILDQVAALHDDCSHVEHAGVLQQVDGELMRVLQHCNDDLKRQKVRAFVPRAPRSR